MTGHLVTCYSALAPSDSKDFALVVILVRLVLGAGEIAHGDKLLQGRATSRNVLSLCYSYVLSIFFRFLVLYFFQDAMEYKNSSDCKGSLPFPSFFFHSGSILPQIT